MHRHGYKGRKLGRERDQRRALLKGLAESLILNESIETTLPKAKELRPKVEKLVTKAKKNTLHTRRQILSALATKEAAHKLVDEMAPMIKRSSGYLRIEKTRLRRGDSAQMARISFVDDFTKPVAKSTKAKKTTADKAAETKPKTAKAAAKRPAAKKTTAKTKTGSKK